jgi:hypothetical protein
MLRRLVREQSGIAVPVAVMVLLICLLLVSASALRAQGTLGHANRDRWEKQALQAAEAGLRTAIYRTNAGSFDVGVLVNPSLSQQCLVRVSGQLTEVPIAGTLLGGRTWCRVVEGDLGNNASYSYRVSNTATPNLSSPDRLLDKRIVATGMAGPSGRRVERRVGVEIEAQATRVDGLLEFSEELKLFEVVAGSFRECRGPVPAADEDPWTDC